MCLTTRFPFIKTKKPIFCYKVVRKDYTSQYQNFPYELNKLYVLNSNLTAESVVTSLTDIVPEGLEDKYGKYPFRSKKLLSKFPNLKAIDHGFHAYRTLEYACSCAEFFELIVVKCVIPEGSTIGINYNEIVSNQIAIIEQVKYDNNN